MSTQIEPAIRSYFFGKGYTDLKAVIEESWRRNRDSAKECFSRILSTGQWWENTSSFVFFGGAGLSVFVFGTLSFLVASLLHIIFLSILFSLIYIGFTLVWIVERAFLFFHGFFAVCPYCHEKNRLPAYLCDNCGSVHMELVPNKYGIFYHKCICGQKLPATFFVNRGRLQAKCPNRNCHQYLEREHVETKRIFIPILGGASSGKTAFMFSAVRMLIEKEAADYGFTAEFIDTNTETEYTNIVMELKNGHEPKKTISNVPRAFNLALKQNKKIKWLMYIYDPAGEVYLNTEDLSEHRYHEYLNGLVLIVDPFSIPAVRRNYEYELSKTWSSLNPSQQRVQEVLGRVILTMEGSFGLSKTSKIGKPLAVVISKVDAFDLEELLGESAVDKAIAETKGAERTDVRNTLIRRQLNIWGEEALLQQLDTRFKSVRFFTCSALGRIPDSSGRDLVSHHVFDPILWICKSVGTSDFDIKA